MMEYHELVQRQREFFNSGATLKIEERKKLLRTLRKMLVTECSKLTEAVHEDLRRLPELTYSLEVSNALVEIDYVLEYLNDWASPETVEKTFFTLLDTPMIVKDPYGVVLIIAPWNYPVNLIMLPLIPAIAAGNTVIIKPSELAPHTAKVISEIVPRYFDPNNVAVVCGGAAETTELLKERFDYIFYTGGPSVAKSIMAAAAKNLTPVTFELGGKCPVVVEDDADIEKSAKRIAWGKWLNCGQTCLAPDYILVKKSLKPELLNMFCQVAKEFYGENAQESRDYSRIINERHFDRLKQLIDDTKGVLIYKGGEFDRSDLFVPPCIVEVEADDVLMKDEIFGPILPIVTVDGLDDAIAFIKSREKALAAYLFTKDKKKAKRFYTETSSGAVCINDVILHLAVDTLPFGGVGNSGMGEYRGKFGFDTFTHRKAVLQRAFFSEKLTAARYPPLTKEKFEHLKSLTCKRRGLPRWFRKYCPTLPMFLLTLILCLFLRRYGLR